MMRSAWGGIGADSSRIRSGVFGVISLTEAQAREIATQTDVQQRKVRIALCSVGCGIALVVIKLIVGIAGGSVSIISEAIHSAMDLLAAIIALFSVKTSSLPADRNHPFGHGKIENISGTIEALLIFVAALWIIWEAVHKLLLPHPLETVGLGVAVMLISTVANAAVAQVQFKVGKETDSIALLADAWHHLTDVYTSAGVMAGLAIIWAGSFFAPDVHFDWLDPVAAIGVACLIIKAAWDLVRQSAGGLMDETLPPEEQEEIRRLICSQSPVIHGYHKLRTRKAGQFRFIEVHIQVDADMSVDAAHRLNEVIERLIQEHFRHVTVTVHTEPCNGTCDTTCLAGCLLTETERSRIQRALA
jgi:cation diffusion facilitator family transporter